MVLIAAGRAAQPLVTGPPESAAQTAAIAIVIAALYAAGFWGRRALFTESPAARPAESPEAALTAMLATAPAFAWEPTKPVEIVVAAGAGGASDQMARMMQAAIQKNNLMKQPMVVSLKGGASGAEALMYMKSSDGDSNKVLIAYSLIYMLPLSAKIPFN